MKWFSILIISKYPNKVYRKIVTQWLLVIIINLKNAAENDFIKLNHFHAFLIYKFHPTNITLLLTHWPTHHHISWRKKSPSYIFVVFTIIVVSSGFCFKSFLSFSNYVPFCATIWLFICGTRNFFQNGLYNFDGCLVHCYNVNEAKY